MKKHFVTDGVISIMAPVVKIFPMWAVKYTLKSNPYAYKFQLSHQKEMKVLRQIYTTGTFEDLKPIPKHIWHKETRIACLRDPDMWRIFVDDIQNSEEFKAAYYNKSGIAQATAVRCKTYTLANDEVIAACNYIYTEVMIQKQPGSLRPNVVRALSVDARTYLFSELIKSANHAMLGRLDAVLWDDSTADSENLKRLAQSALNSLMGCAKYVPSLSAEQLVTITGCRVWAAYANPVVVADKMVPYWHKNKQFDNIYQICKRLLSCNEAAKAGNVLSLLPQNYIGLADLVELVLANDVACPKHFGVLIKADKKQAVAQNLSLCAKQHVTKQIPLRDFKLFMPEQREQILIHLAYDNALDEALLKKVEDQELKELLLYILQANAQTKWFSPYMYKKPADEAIETIRNLGTITTKLQQLSMKDPVWAVVFAEQGFYDESSIKLLMNNGPQKAIVAFAQKHGLTQEQYTALLLGKNAGIAPVLERYVK